MNGNVRVDVIKSAFSENIFGYKSELFIFR